MEGVIAGFHCPEYVKGINVPGFHFHFITEDRKAGGHLLDCRLKNVKAEIDYTREFYTVLPKDKEFYGLDLTKEKQRGLEKVEK